ncbi:MAG: CHAT domain-containing protein [Acidobacteria bacterium]|nr:CHAT domain-containing protein [Acidobacteriota bacterium]
MVLRTGRLWLLLMLWPVLARAQSSLLDRASAAVRTGHYRDGYVLAEQAAAEFERASDWRQASKARNMMGNALFYEARYAEARRWYELSLKLARQAGDQEAEVLRWNNLGNVAMFLGQYGEADRAYQEAQRTASTKWPEAAMTTTVNHATLLQRLGKDREALDLYLKLRPQAVGLPLVSQGQLAANLGALYRRLGDPYRARELYHAALQQFQQAKFSDGIIGTLKNIGIAEAVEFQDYPQARQLFQQALKQAQQSENGRERLVITLYLAEVAFRQAHWPEAEQLWKTALDLSVAQKAPEQQWRALYGLGRVAAQQGGDSQRYLREAVQVIEQLRADVATGSRTEFLADKREVYDSYIAGLWKGPQEELFGWLERSRARTQAERQAVPRLAELQTRLRDGELMAIYWVSGPRAALLWVKKEAVGEVELPNAPRPREPWLFDAAAYLPDDLRRGVRHVIVVPDGWLATVPFVFPGIAVSTLPAARLLRDATANSQDSRRPAMALAAAQNQDGLPPLPGAAAEVKVVEATLSLPWRSLAARTAPGELGKTALLRELPGLQVLHVAAHAVVDTERPNRSRLVLADSTLSAGEFEKLDLGGLDLVTLSACQTAQGRLVAGDGVQSLTAAFLRAGAHSVVASLWPVSDAAALEFMRQFYAALAHGHGKAEALRIAQQRLRDSGGALAEPRHWAAFVLHGDGRGVITGSPRLSPMALMAAGGVILLLAAIWWIKARA